MSILKSAKNSARTVVAAFVALAFLAFGAIPASAHDALIESNPSDGETLTSTTDVIVLSFNNTISDLGGKILVTPQNGEEIEADLKANGKDAVLEMKQPLPNDEYVVSWRVVSSDSHPIEGQFSFAIDDPENTTPAAQTTDAQETPTPETTATTQETSAPEETTSAPEVTSPESQESQDSGVNWGRMAIFGGLGAAVGILLVVLGNKRGRRL